MSSVALIVRVTDGERATCREYVFASSPIRVGRSQLNELPLEHAFVSHCHGQFLFDRHQLLFVDSGSTNGSFLHGTRLPKDQRVALRADSTITIGALSLDARLELREPGKTRASYTFAAHGVAPTRVDDVHAGALANARARPTDAVGTSSSAPSSTGARQQRSVLLNERFARSFVELRRGQRQLLRELGLPVPSADKLHALDDARELLAYLLDPAAPDDRLGELSRASADLMAHELALVRALRAGCRELLDELSPHNLAPDGLGGIAGWLARLFGHDARWRLLEHKTSELQEQTALSSVVLGRSFARAYAAALGHGTDGEHTARPGVASPAPETNQT